MDILEGMRKKKACKIQTLPGKGDIVKLESAGNMLNGLD